MKRKQIKRLENNTFVLRKVKFGDFRGLLGEKINNRYYNPINIGEYKMSIQASDYHYCNPRVNTEVENYNSMEVAIFKSDSWSRPSCIKGIEKYDNLWESGDISVAGYVEINIIQDIFNILSTRYK